ncbi:hypothetical protein SDC9_119342 [bioreactor metagenome]|uniref:Uncharacterized protein n=1 Tax=bioreactor metagenome TaxID=1076179 RepID=A0A645C4R0_9ZZZZ
MQADHIGFFEQCVEIDIAADGSARVVLIRVKGEHTHAKRLCDLARALPDAAKADDAHRLSFQLDERIVPEAPVDIAAPAARVHRVAVMRHVMADFEQHSDCKLPHRRRAIGRDIANGDSALFCGGSIHNVVACRQHADVLHARACRQRLSRERRLVGQNRVRIFDAGDDFLLRRAVVHRHLAERFQRAPAQVSGVEGKSIQYYDFHTSFFSL